MKIIITEKQFTSLKLRRRIWKIPNYIRSTYEWLTPNAFNNFEEFLDRVIFSATRDFVSENMEPSEDYEKMKMEFTPIISELVNGVFYSELVDYYNKKN